MRINQRELLSTVVDTDDLTDFQVALVLMLCTKEEDFSNYRAVDTKEFMTWDFSTDEVDLSEADWAVNHVSSMIDQEVESVLLAENGSVALTIQALRATPEGELGREILLGYFAWSNAYHGRSEAEMKADHKEMEKGEGIAELNARGSDLLVKSWLWNHIFLREHLETLSAWATTDDDIKRFADTYLPTRRNGGQCLTSVARNRTAEVYALRSLLFTGASMIASGAITGEYFTEVVSLVEDDIVELAPAILRLLADPSLHGYDAEMAIILA